MRLGNALDKAVAVVSFDPTNWESFSTSLNIELARPEAGMRVERGFTSGIGSTGFDRPYVDATTNYLKWSGGSSTAKDAFAVVVFGTDRGLPMTFQPPLIVVASLWKPATFPSGMKIGFGARINAPNSWDAFRPDMTADTDTYQYDTSAGCCVMIRGEDPAGIWRKCNKSVRRTDYGGTAQPFGPPTIVSSATESVSLWTGGFYVSPYCVYYLEPSIGMFGVDMQLRPISRSSYTFEPDMAGFEVWAGVASTKNMNSTFSASYMGGITAIQLAEPLSESKLVA